jgi:hypothetical protein
MPDEFVNIRDKSGVIDTAPTGRPLLFNLKPRLRHAASPQARTIHPASSLGRGA